MQSSLHCLQFSRNKWLKFGKHTVFERLFKGVFKERTPPSYIGICGVTNASDYIKTCNVSEETLLSVLPNFLATLMNFLSGQLSQTISSLSLSHMLL